MKDKNLHTAIAYCFLIIGMLLFISGCRTKKSQTDFKQTEIENVSVTDNSTVSKTETVQENNQEKKSETVTDKSFFEAWMEIKSDEATFEDKAGNKWTFKNPQVNQKSSQINDIAKTEQTEAETKKVATSEENQQKDVVVKSTNESKIDIQQKNSSKGKEPIWLYAVGAVLVGSFGYFILKRFKIV